MCVNFRKSVLVLRKILDKVKNIVGEFRQQIMQSGVMSLRPLWHILEQFYGNFERIRKNMGISISWKIWTGKIYNSRELQNDVYSDLIGGGHLVWFPF